MDLYFVEWTNILYNEILLDGGGKELKCDLKLM